METCCLLICCRYCLGLESWSCHSGLGVGAGERECVVGRRQAGNVLESCCLRVRRGRAALCAGPTLVPLPTAVGVSPLLKPFLSPSLKLLLSYERLLVLSNHGLARFCHFAVLAYFFGCRRTLMDSSEVPGIGPLRHWKAQEASASVSARRDFNPASTVMTH